MNKYIHYKSNVLSSFSLLEPVLTPALDIGIAKSGSNLVHSPPGHILCLTSCVNARKSFRGVLPCLVMMYHQTNLDCKSFSISEDLTETIVALTLNIAKWYFWTIFGWWWSCITILSLTEIVQANICLSSEPSLWPWPWIQQSNLFTRHSNLRTCTVKLSWSPKYQQFRTYNRNSHDFIVWTQTQLLWPWPWR